MTKQIQTELKRLGFYKGAIDGDYGKLTTAAVKAFQASKGLYVDGDAGPRTQAALFPPAVPIKPGSRLFDSKSAINLGKLHPDLQLVLTLAREEMEFRVLDATRGRAAQEAAYKAGNSKARFGDSAHNYMPAIAVDVFPAPYDWNNVKAFDALATIILRIAKAKKIPLRWGGDWNMDGDKTKSDSWDKPHFELHPWREYARKAKLYEG